MPDAARPVRPGRPRDPEVDTRVLHAAASLFGETGWSGFSIDAVAREAGVGKASIYLRWPSKEALLAEALQHGIGHIADADTGTLRGDLVRLAIQELHLYLGEHGLAALRIGIEAPTMPALGQQWDELRRSQVLAARAVVRRGIRRGELPASTSVTLLLDCIIGGSMLHVLSTPPELRPQLEKRAAAYAEELVDFVLRSVEAGG